MLSDVQMLIARLWGYLHQGHMNVFLSQYEMHLLLCEIERLEEDACHLRLENGKLEEKVKNPDITSLWGKPMSYWMTMKAYMDQEFPMSDVLAATEVENAKLKVRVEELLQACDHITENLYSSYEELRDEQTKYRKLEGELEELKQKLLELGGCPNA